jgi:hypothetical protein
MTDDLVRQLREAERQYVDNEYNLHGRAAERIEELIFGPGGIMEMKQTIADKEKRIAQLETIIEWSGMPYPEDK